MKAFIWLALSGAVWLLLIQLANLASIPPQIISLLRTIYLGTTSILLMAEIRQQSAIDSRLFFSFRDFNWCLVPIVPFLLTCFLSDTLQINSKIILFVASFYITQLLLQLSRAHMKQMRSGIWEILPPILVAILISATIAVYAMLLISIIILLYLMVRSSNQALSRNSIVDSMFMQLPSICIAPIALFLFRDVLSLSTTIDRSNLEIVGMICNGLGASLWTTIVMRSQKLPNISINLWLFGFIIAIYISLNYINISDTFYAILSMLSSELLRGSLWLGLTYIMSKSGKWRGFVFNLLGTLFPLVSVLISKSLVPAQQVIGILALINILIPATLWFYKHNQQIS